MIKIAAVDDERHALERFEKIAAGVSGIRLLGLYDTSEEIISHLKRENLDVVFLDIEMPGQNGLQLFKQLQAIDPGLDIVFVTAYKNYAIDAFEMNALDYILKPVTEERFNRTIRRIQDRRRPEGYTVKPFIQCLGDFEVFVNGSALTWKNSKAKEILGFLVQKKGVPVNWEKIADAVWPDYNAEKSHSNFHATTYLLRKRLAEAGISDLLENNRGNYRVMTDRFTCDYYDLEKKLSSKMTNREEDYKLIEKMVLRGYMESSGYEWAMGKGGELEMECFRILSQKNQGRTI